MDFMKINRAFILAEALSGIWSSQDLMRLTPLASRRSKNRHVSIIIQEILKVQWFLA
jgi:hypothetical protein